MSTPKLPPWNQVLQDERGETLLVWRTWFEAVTAQLAEHEALTPGYGAALPSVATQADGRYFTLTTTQTLYQVQSGAWVAVDMVP
jgi:hypothetical protein